MAVTDDSGLEVRKNFHRRACEQKAPPSLAQGRKINLKNKNRRNYGEDKLPKDKLQACRTPIGASQSERC
jgi:hypothetical protein